MKAFSVLALILPALQTTLVEATVYWDSRSDTNLNWQKAQDGFREAINVAKKVVQDLSPGNALTDDRIKAAFDPLFQETHKARVLEIFNAIATVETVADHQITFFLTEDHIQWGSDVGHWIDTAFWNPTNRLAPLEPGIGIGSTNLPQKPGFQCSYTFQGYDNRLVNPNGVDFSAQKHIFLHPWIFTGNTGSDNSGWDKRSLDVIKQDGFGTDQYSTSLGRIQPVSKIILHELVHAVGGRYPSRVDPNHPGQLIVGEGKINDGPNGDTYGWRKCADLSRSNTPGSTPVDIADPYAILGLALYLDNVKDPTKHSGTYVCYWSFGWVDRGTGEPQWGISPHRKRDLNFVKFDETNYAEQQQRYHHDHQHHPEHGNSETFNDPGSFKHVDRPDTAVLRTRGLAGRVSVPV